MSELLLREATHTDVDKRLRLIDMIAVPWDQEADVMWRGEMWREVFRRGAFDGLENHAGRVPVEPHVPVEPRTPPKLRIPVNREHTPNQTVGKVVSTDPYSELGLLARVKVAATARGDETLQLAEEDMLSASIGFRIERPGDVRLNKRTKMREVLRAFLDHIALVASPAYEGAQVLAVREEQSGLAVVEIPLPETPALDEFLNDEVLAWASSRRPEPA